MDGVPRTPVAWLPKELDGLHAIAAATLDNDGKLLEANEGFARLLTNAQRRAADGNVRDWFVHPNFSTITATAASDAALTYSGLLNVATDSGTARTLRGRVWRVGAHWQLLAEFDIEELERVYASVLQINEDYAFTQAKLAQLNVALQQREAQILSHSLTDALTGVGNRRALDRALPLEIGRAIRTGDKLSAIMCDLDHFKRVNDTYGHEAGDKVLAHFGEILRTHMRPTDILTRYGGEEFVVLTPDTDLESAVDAAERIRLHMASTTIAPLEEPVTVSFGVAELAPGEQATSLLRRIDNALYAAKQAGRNRVATG